MKPSSHDNKPHGGGPIHSTGKPMDQAKAAMIIIHGRGDSAQNILQLSSALFLPDIIYLAPQASGNTWYPYSFLEPIHKNEPGISSGLEVIRTIIDEISKNDIPKEKIILTGWSQGACLASEFVARNPHRYGGLILFSGGLIGPLGLPRNYSGSLEETPVFLGCSDKDFHIPLERVKETAMILEHLGGRVNLRIYPDMGHTIIEDEISQANQIVQNLNLSH